jgi:hypothetical protein
MDIQYSLAQRTTDSQLTFSRRIAASAGRRAVQRLSVTERSEDNNDSIGGGLSTGSCIDAASGPATKVMVRGRLPTTHLVLLAALLISRVHSLVEQLRKSSTPALLRRVRAALLSAHLDSASGRRELTIGCPESDAPWHGCRIVRTRKDNNAWAGSQDSGNLASRDGHENRMFSERLSDCGMRCMDLAQAASSEITPSWSRETAGHG